MCWSQKPQINPLAPKSKHPAPAEVPVKPGTHDMTPEDVSAFLDGIMPQQLAKDDIAGAVISIVKDGKVIFAKGYGYSDVAKKTPVSADNTLFRPGSISKLFTWTAVMQQVEAGRLDLNADVNRYLTAFKVPATYPQPVTLQTLLNHTSGFEDRVIGTGARTAADVPPLGGYLGTHMPARIRPPGRISAYSNYGAALATNEAFTPDCGGCIGPQGPAGPAGAGLVQGAILILPAGSASPAGFTRIATMQQQVKDLSGHPQNVTWDVYQKN